MTSRAVSSASVALAATGRWFVRTLAAMAILTAFAASTQAQTISEILNRKKVVVGVLVDFPPFGTMNAKQEPDGYDIDLAKLMAKDLGVELELVPVATANRIPYLISKRVDVLVASLGITPDRAKQVMFTIPYANSDVVISAPKKVALKSIAELTKFSVAVARGSSQEGYISAIAPKDAKIMRFDGDGTASQAMLSGQSDALAGSAIMIASVAKANPSLGLETKITLRRQANAMAVRQDAFEFQQWLNAFIYHKKSTGDLNAIHMKWIGSPLEELPVF